MKKALKVPGKKNLRKIKSGRSNTLKTEKKLCPKVLSKLRQLSRLLKEHNAKCWEIGDICIELMDYYQLPLGQIAEFTRYSKARISHFHLTARTFPFDQRQGCTFEDSLTARQIWVKLPSLNMSPLQIREQISTMKNKRPRQVRTYYIKMLMEKERNQSLAISSKIGLKGNGLINNCHNIDYREIIPKMPNSLIKLFICDPPFGAYQKTIDGTYTSPRNDASGLRADCDNGSTEEALEVTLPLFDLCLPKLAPDGTLLLFQPGGKPDRPEILQKADSYGWKCSYALSWLKGSIIAGNSIHPYRVSTERILVFNRKGDLIRKHESSFSLPDVLNFQTETKSATVRMDYGKIKIGDCHIFQKPARLMDSIIKQHTYPSEVVCTPFGCSGVGVMAAAKLRRKWIYIESNRNNFVWGSERIQKTIDQLEFMAG